MMSDVSFFRPRRGGFICLLLLLSAAAALIFVVENTFSSAAGLPEKLHRRLSSQDQRSLEYASASVYSGIEQGELTNESPTGQAESTTGKKPRFVIHMGPMKTGTSSLQRDLMWRIQEFLNKDGWYYIGGSEPMEQIPMEDPEEFLEMFETAAKELRKRNMNMIRSREQYSGLFYSNQWMFKRLHDMLKDDWDVMITSGYRPYFEWLPSYWFQGQRLKYTDPKHPEQRHMNPWTHKRTEKFQLIEPMFPSFFDFWKNVSRFTDSIIEPAKKYFPTRVFDIHDPRGARSAFLCDVLGEGAAPNACEESLRLHRETPPRVINPSNPSEVQYDAIALAAASKGMVNMEKWDRVTVIDEITIHQEEVLRRHVFDFPLNCPTQEYLDKFWQMSRNFDLRYMPEQSEEDPDHLDKLYEKFQIAVEEKKYCIVDVDAVLEDSEWKTFFQKFA